MNKKWNLLLARFKQLDNSVVAFSGGTDSTLLLFAASQAGSKVLAVTATADVYQQAETTRAGRVARELGVPHIFAYSDILSVEDFTNNSKDRCYFCKKNLIHMLRKIAQENNCSYILDGTNADDIHDYRPGLKALSEGGIISPLREVGLTKKEILELTKEFGLPITPGNTCLASRIPYGTPINRAELRQIEQAEELLHTLGFKECRVRHHGDIARIEVPEGDIEKITDETTRKTILSNFEKLGFIYTAADLRGYVTGSLNKPLTKEALEWKPKD